MNDNNKIYIHKLSDIDTIPTSNKYETLNRNEVKLLTYNFFLRPPPIKTNENDYKSERLNDFISTHLKEYDIICFQEMFDTFHNRKKLMIQQQQLSNLVQISNSQIIVKFLKEKSF